MSEIKINLPDGSSMEVPQSFTVADLANKISEGLGRVAVAAKINENIVDLNTILKNDDNVKILTSKDAETLDILRHSRLLLDLQLKTVFIMILIFLTLLLA